MSYAYIVFLNNLVDFLIYFKFRNQNEYASCNKSNIIFEDDDTKSTNSTDKDEVLKQRQNEFDLKRNNGLLTRRCFTQNMQRNSNRKHCYGKIMKYKTDKNILSPKARPIQA